ncbi:D-alanyl-D-alanine carboxypeptidase/D-alanyl-D-alanine-endopeptidase [Gryllotalpicola reticulitermitis]|uniref:D-alanyl-D-alanine carboxypeptidase/D-alanyl-D-alanine-endopeptidase n=1 Tax=Gryllotalpicola reticulitermitis TaxID=1184153 RepID=A0ABV8Q7V9_9MICO
MTDPNDPRNGDEFLPTAPFTPVNDEQQGADPHRGPVIVDASQGPKAPGAGRRMWAGIFGSVRNHPTSWMIAAATAAVVIVGGGSFVAGAATPSAPDAATLTAPVATHTAIPTPSQTPTPTPTPTVTARPTASPAAAASALKTCSVAGPASDARLGTLEAQVVDAKTGQVLFDRNGETPAPTASVMKTITAAATLAALGPSYQISTTVVKGSQPGQVVIVGGGDPTLGTGGAQWYQGAPTLTQLATQVKQAWAKDPANAGHPITSVVADTSLFGGPSWQPSWPQDQRTGEGSTAEIVPLIADGDKQNPSLLESPRGSDPAGDAAKAFAQDLGAQYSGAGTAASGAAQLGVVKSQPVSALLNEALLNSDNTVMEYLARLTAIKEGTGNSFTAIQAADVKALKAYGLDASHLTIVDGSGLSADNRVPPSFLTSFMIKVLNREQGLGQIYDSLPISGQTGTLATQQYGRFEGASAVADGHVHAKTGWITGGYTLAGIIDAKDGSQLSFAIFALGNVGDSAKAAIDTLTAAIYNCGDNLSNS